MLFGIVVLKREAIIQSSVAEKRAFHNRFVDHFQNLGLPLFRLLRDDDRSAVFRVDLDVGFCCIAIENHISYHRKRNIEKILINLELIPDILAFHIKNDLKLETSTYAIIREEKIRMSLFLENDGVHIRDEVPHGLADEEFEGLRSLFDGGLFLLFLWVGAGVGWVPENELFAF